MFCTFWLPHVLRTRTACTFSTSQLPKVVWKWCVSYILTSKCASRHPVVQLFISHLAPALASLLVDPPEPQTIGKTQCFATFLPFRAPASSFFCLFLFSDLLSSVLLFSDSSHLCFSICPYYHIVGSLTSKLPSMMNYCSMFFFRVICIYIYLIICIRIVIYICVCRSGNGVYPSNDQFRGDNGDEPLLHMGIYIYNGYIYIWVELVWYENHIYIYKWDFTLFNHPEKFLWLSRNIMNTVKTWCFIMVVMVSLNILT